MSGKQQLSVTLITYNEETHVREALESVAWADEIVVIDSFSSDRTVAICREYTPHVFQVDWHGYVEQKNIATEKATYPWILNIDADERVSAELAQEIQRTLSDKPQYAGFLMPRKTFYLGGWIAHCGWYPDRKLRLFQRHAGRWVGQALHERVDVRGKTALLQHDLYHYTYENIADHLCKMNDFTSIAANHSAKNISALGILLRTGFTFLKKFLLQQGFRDGTRGMIVSLLSALTVCVKYSKIWERQHVHSKKI